ncbi:hypothetical protein B0H10DRAFT_40600 [Mycena sp. CBHHK59/15]|nr:hypothetical protein B0H10DRAFT_40600 [Mycena sp. CBHHK59/15]
MYRRTASHCVRSGARLPGAIASVSIFVLLVTPIDFSRHPERGRAGPDTSRSQLTLAIRNHIQARDDLKPLTLPEAAWAKCASDGSLQSLGELVLQAVLLELIQDSGYTLSVKRKEVVLASLSSPRTLATILDMCTGSFPAGGLDAQVRAAAFLVYVGGLYTCTSAPDLPRLAFAQLREWLGGVFQPMVRVAVGAPMRHKGTKDVIVISYADLEAAQYEREMEDVMLVDVSNSLVSRVEPPEDFVSRIVKDIGLLCLTDESVTDDVFSL